MNKRIKISFGACAICMIVVFCGGCANRTVLDSNFAGVCLKTESEMYWVATGMSKTFSKSRILSASKESQSSIHDDSFELLDTIPKGTQIEIDRVERWDLYGGSYLRIIGRMREGAYKDELFDLTACNPYRHGPRVTMECVMNPEFIHFNPEYLGPCD